MYTKEQIAYLRKREAEEGLPPGILAELAMKESSQGRNMLNPSSGAAGHYGIMPFNYKGKFDPNDFKASTEWTIDYAKQALERFPEMDPAKAIKAHHFGGPNTKIWGPQTKEYAGLVAGSSTGENTMPPGILDPNALAALTGSPTSSNAQPPQNLDIAGLLALTGGGGPATTPAMNPAQEHLWAQLAQIPGVGGEQSQQSNQGFGQRALMNPWLQMGLGILTADPSRGPLAAIAGGVQKGLLGVNAAEQQAIQNQQQEQQRRQAQMWQSLQAAQTMQDILKQAQKFEDSGRTTIQDIASGAAAFKNIVDARKAQHEMQYGKPERSSSPYAVLNPDRSIAGTVVRNQRGEWVNPVTGSPFDFKPGQYFAQPPGGTVAGGSMGSAAPETAANRDRMKTQAKGFADLDDRLTALIDKYDTQKNSFGTVGAVGEKFVGAGQTMDALGNQIFGTDSTMLGDAATSVFGDPTEIRTLLEQLRQPVARLMVDEKGPLATQEQQMARELIGSVTLEDALRSPQQVLTKLKSLRDLARKGRSNIDATLYGDGVTIGEVSPAKGGPPAGSGISREIWDRLSPDAKATIRKNNGG